MKKLRRSGFWIRIFCVMLVILGGCNRQFHNDPVPEDKTATQTNQKTPEEHQAWEFQPEDPLQKDYTATTLLDDIYKLLDIIVGESVEIISDKEDQMFLLLAGGGSIALHASTADDTVADNFSRNSILSHEIDKITDLLGGPGIHFAVTGLWYLMAEDNEDTASKERAWTMLRALSVTGAASLGLKAIIHNRTPNGKFLAWPSGHTSSSFTVAAVLDEFYGPEVGFPAYLGAGFVGYRMMDSGDHWASDVLFGAILGYVVGHHIGGKHMDLEMSGFNVTPYAGTLHDENVLGISLVKSF